MRHAWAQHPCHPSSQGCLEEALKLCRCDAFRYHRGLPCSLKVPDWDAIAAASHFALAAQQLQTLPATGGNEPFRPCCAPSQPIESMLCSMPARQLCLDACQQQTGSRHPARPSSAAGKPTSCARMRPATDGSRAPVHAALCTSAAPAAPPDGSCLPRRGGWLCLRV